MQYTVWGKDGVEFTVVEGEQLPAWATSGMQLLKVIDPVTTFRSVIAPGQ